MPRVLKTDKFFIYAPNRSRPYKGCRLLGSLGREATLQELLDFLKKHGVEPSKVPIPLSFIVNTKV